MPSHKCIKCGKIFASNGDLNRHIKKKNPCIYIENLKDILPANIIIPQKDFLSGSPNGKLKDVENAEDTTYENELKRIYTELTDDIYLHVFNKLEKNEKFKKLYEDTLNKIFQKFYSMCERKVFKNGDTEEYKRDFCLFDEKQQIISNNDVKNKLIAIFKDNEKYFNKRLLKYAKNIMAELYDVKYIDLED
jgi:hypothetical protein